MFNKIGSNFLKENEDAPWLWILCAGLLFALIFTVGYNAKRIQQSFSGIPVAGAAMPDATYSIQDYGSDPASSSCSGADSTEQSCTIQTAENSCNVSQGELCHADMEMAQVAWKYFENNYIPETGLVNAVNNYPSTTMWDTGSALAATITANDLGLITPREFDERIMAMFKTLSSMQLFNNEAPNKVYSTKTIDMVDYGNKPTDAGIGVSILDLARLISWLNTLNCMHPQYNSATTAALSRWDYSRLIQDGSMYGLARSGDEIKVLQEGRLGYEQYAAKILEHVGFDLPVASSYENKFRGNTDILGVSIAHDIRDPRKLGANNYVVTESYAMDAMESGIDSENKELLDNIFEVQKRRWKETGIVTAISEDNIDQEPWFLYNSIFNAGLAWQTTNSSNTSYDNLKTVSIKAALSMAMLYPDDEYGQVLSTAVQHAYDPEKGWYSGIYENGAGYNKAFTANTNGVILEGLLHKKYGALLPHCNKCSQPIRINSPLIELKDESKDLVVSSNCDLAHQQCE